MDPGTAYLVKQFKAEIEKQGGNGFHSLQRRFRIIDDDNNNCLSLNEFKKGCHDLGLTKLNDNEIRTMFRHFDRVRMTRAIELHVYICECLLVYVCIYSYVCMCMYPVCVD